jgi:hypothetical protein
MSVDSMLDKTWNRKVRNGEPCVMGMCGRTDGVKRPDGTTGECPTCQRQREIWDRVGDIFWRFPGE